MATTLNIPQASASVGWSFSKTNAWGTPTSNQASFSYSGALTQGSAGTAGACGKVIVDQVTITAGSTQTYTLDSFTDMFGQTTQAMTVVRLIWIEHETPAATATAEVSGTMMQITSNTGGIISATTTSGKIQVGPGGLLYIERTDATAYTVTATTGNTITIKNNDAASISVNVVIAGA